MEYSIAITKSNYKDGGTYWKAAPFKLTDLLEKVGPKIKFVIWNIPRDTDEQKSAFMNVEPAYQGKTKEIYFGDKGPTAAFLGMWGNKGKKKDGEPWWVLNTQGFEVTELSAKLGNDVVIFINKNNKKELDTHPDFRMKVLKATRKASGSNQQYNKTASDDTTSADNTDNKDDDLPF